MRAGTRPNASILEASGRIKWTSDLADIPAKYGVTNVYGDLGTSFANSAVAHPKFAAALLGTMIKGLGADHVVWGMDAVWYGRRNGRSKRCGGWRFL